MLAFAPPIFAPLDGATGTAYLAVTALSDVVTPFAGTAAAPVAIVLFTVLVRLVISPLSVAQVRGQRRQAALAPRIREVRRRHADDPARLRAELAALYRETGTTPLAGCLPALAQAPFFLVMYRLFTARTVGGAGNDLLGERLLGVPLGQRLLDAPAGTAPLVFLGLLAALGALAWLTSRRIRRATMTDHTGGTGIAGDAAVGRLLPLLPYAVLPAAAVVPLAAGLYLLTSTAWTALEQRLLRHQRAPDSR